jgi:hypothetical protein
MSNEGWSKRYVTPLTAAPTTGVLPPITMALPRTTTALALTTVLLRTIMALPPITAVPAFILVLGADMGTTKARSSAAARNNWAPLGTPPDGV